MGKTFAGLFLGNSDVTQNDSPGDFSWLLIAITRDGHPIIIDGAEDFWIYDMIMNGECAIDNGVVIPKGLLNSALYRVDNIEITGGGPDYNGEYWGPDISGEWTRVYPLQMVATPFPEFEATIKIRPVSGSEGVD